jgi:CRP-like cAMP-binding protein
VCVAGDNGDNFYVVDSGAVEVFKKLGEGPETKVGGLRSRPVPVPTPHRVSSDGILATG